MLLSRKTLSANHIEFPQYHTVREITSLGDSIDQRKVFLGGKERREQRFRLYSLYKDIRLHGMTHPIIVNTWNNDKVAVGNQRLWYAKEHGYTHIDCYECANDTIYLEVFNFCNSETYWKKYMNDEVKELIAKEITHPQYHQLIPLDELTYKWDNVTGNWESYANVRGINYKKLFEDMDQNGMLHPIMVRRMNGKYRKWQAGGRRILWAKKNGYTHISAYVLESQDDVDRIYTETYDETYK